MCGGQKGIEMGGCNMERVDWAWEGYGMGDTDIAVSAQGQS